MLYRRSAYVACIVVRRENAWSCTVQGARGLSIIYATYLLHSLLQVLHGQAPNLDHFYKQHWQHCMECYPTRCFKLGSCLIFSSAASITSCFWRSWTSRMIYNVNKKTTYIFVNGCRDNFYVVRAVHNGFQCLNRFLWKPTAHTHNNFRWNNEMEGNEAYTVE
jgi:hypothetical protein